MYLYSIKTEQANQLYQYIGTICEAATNFIWQNVYDYNQLFRQLITAFPDRSWAVIYHHGYLMCLKEHIPPHNPIPTFMKAAKSNNGKDREICWLFNKGHCSYGHSCKFDHRCAYCNKQGHSKQNCRLRMKDKHEKGDSNNNAVKKDDSPCCTTVNPIINNDN